MDWRRWIEIRSHCYFVRVSKKKKKNSVSNNRRERERETRCNEVFGDEGISKDEKEREQEEKSKEKEVRGEK